MKKQRQTNEQSLKEVISELFESNHMSSKLKEAQLVQNWEKLVGKLIAKNTLKIYIHNRKLYLHLESAALKTELTYSKSKLIEVINTDAACQLIDDIVIR